MWCGVGVVWGGVGCGGQGWGWVGVRCVRVGVWWVWIGGTEVEHSRPNLAPLVIAGRGRLPFILVPVEDEFPPHEVHPEVGVQRYFRVVVVCSQLFILA